MTSLAPLHFYFDFISPYGYFASLRIDELAARFGRTVEWHPMLLGVSVMKVMGLKPLLETPLKGPYTRNDVRRYARQHGVMLGREPDLAPMNPLTCGRAMAWARQAQPSSATDLARAMLHAYWNAGIDLSSPSSLATIKLPLAISAAELVAATSSAQAAQLLRDEVDASLKSGVFGSPTVSVDGELFWGIDKFDQIQSWLLKGPW
jgi:2-hydroxychromene-2-carboxylate isomerase